MFKFTFLLIFFAGIFYQTVEASSKDDAKKAFHEMMNAIDKALTKAQEALNSAMEKVKAKATELEGKARAELDKVLAPLRQKLDDLVAKAKAKGFDVTKCQKYVDHFSNTPDRLVHDLIDCVNTQISKAQNYVNDALNNAKKIEQDLNNIDQEIDNCSGSKWSQIKCYAKILQKIAKDTKDAPQHIIEDATKASALVANIVPILEQCFTDKLKNAGVDAGKDVTDFAVCAAVPF